MLTFEDAEPEDTSDAFPATDIPVIAAFWEDTTTDMDDSNAAFFFRCVLLKSQSAKGPRYKKDIDVYVAPDEICMKRSFDLCNNRVLNYNKNPFTGVYQFIYSYVVLFIMCVYVKFYIQKSEKCVLREVSYSKSEKCVLREVSY